MHTFLLEIVIFGFQSPKMIHPKKRRNKEKKEKDSRRRRRRRRRRRYHLIEMLTYQQKGKMTVCEEGVEDFFCGLNTCFFCCCVAATNMQAPTQHKPIATTDEIDQGNREKSAVAVRCAKKARSSTRERERLGFRSKS
jgi:hypothetical protein